MGGGSRDLIFNKIQGGLPVKDGGLNTHIYIHSLLKPIYITIKEILLFVVCFVVLGKKKIKENGGGSNSNKILKAGKGMDKQTKKGESQWGKPRSNQLDYRETMNAQELVAAVTSRNRR